MHYNNLKINGSHCSPYYTAVAGQGCMVPATLSMGPTDFSYTMAKISRVSISSRGKGG